MILKYGYEWGDDYDDLSIELHCVKSGIGDLFTHYKNAMSLLWPEDDWHRWADLEIREIAKNTVTTLMGPADSGKTYVAGAKWVLVEYWASPETTLCLVSSTDMRGLELRVWGAIKHLFNRAKERYPWLSGNPLEAQHCIATDSIDDDGEMARVLNRGIVCVPCLQGGRYVGLGKYHGIKAPRLRQVSDECQLMGDSHLDALPNYLGKDFKAVFLGNPLDPLDPLGRIAEPKCGWASHPEPTKTTVWQTRMFGGACVNLVGTDSPNFDFDQNLPPKYPYLINRKKIEAVRGFWGEDSQQYYSQCIGVMKSGMLNRRVISAELCRTHQAMDKAVWKDDKRTRVYATDLAYGGVGGDRCVTGWGEFGEALDGSQILRLHPPAVIPVSIKLPTSPEDQIAAYVKRDLQVLDIQPTSAFYDSTGRGTMGSAFARVFGSVIPVPVEFGGRPTRRPVREDLFIIDEASSVRRLKRCDEHYVDFVSELWFSSRYAIEAGQIRELPDNVMREGCQREYGTAPGNRLYVESKHDPKARERMRQSPDLYDWFVTLLEGARRLGFKIQRLGSVMVESAEDNWYTIEAKRFKTAIRAQLLEHE